MEKRCAEVTEEEKKDGAREKERIGMQGVGNAATPSWDTVSRDGISF